MHIQKSLKLIDRQGDYAIWVIAIAAMLGSLYFSEVRGLPPCTLCWYQRILIYPLVAIFAVAIYRKDRVAAYYAMPLVAIGLIISFYQSLLQWGVIKESLVNCTVNSAVSCSSAQVNWLGFITIPFMSFLAFLFIALLISLRVYLQKINK